MDTFMDKLASRLNAQEMIRANAAAEAKENERLHKEVEVYKQCLEKMREITQLNVTMGDDVSELVRASMDKIAQIQAESGKSEDVLVAMQDNSNAVMSSVKSSSDAVMSSVKSSSDAVMSSVKSSSDVVVAAVKANSDSVMNAISGSSDKIMEMLGAGNDEFKAALISELVAEMKKELKVQEENVHKECVKVYRNVQAVVTDENDKQTKLIIDNQSKMKKKATAALVCGILAMSFAAAGLVVSLLDIFGVFAMLF